MSLFSQRTTGYKAGLSLLLIGCVIFVVGFSFPNWTVMSSTYLTNLDSYGARHGLDLLTVFRPVTADIHGHSGLWITCLKVAKDSKCAFFGSTPSWLLGVRILQSLALLGLATSCLYAVAVNWVLSSPVHNRLVEIIAALSGLLGFAGTLEYMVSSPEDRDKLFMSTDLDLTYLHHDPSKVRASWAFAVDVCGSVLCFLAAVVIGVYNQPLQINPEDEEPATAVTYHVERNTTESQGGQVTIVPQQPAPANPVSYQVIPSNNDHHRGPVTLVPSQQGAPATNVQVFYSPYPGPSTAAPPPAMDVRPPAYEAQYRPPAALAGQFTVVSHPATRGTQCDAGLPAGDTAAMAVAPQPAVVTVPVSMVTVPATAAVAAPPPPPPENKVEPQVPGV
ncbi:uncharacterized protein LOC143291510 [Babylonia areolata]|uniref:uncharacterized protein LOC143291510 n=1 Tax=Babylonia areolata TaxID=304850 RepID=UPI003FD56352